MFYFKVSSHRADTGMCQAGERGPDLPDAFGAGEEAGEADEEDRDDDHEVDGVAVARRDVAGAQLLGDAEQEAADVAPATLPSPPRITTEKALSEARSPFEG